MHKELLFILHLFLTGCKKRMLRWKNMMQVDAGTGTECDRMAFTPINWDYYFISSYIIQNIIYAHYFIWGNLFYTYLNSKD